MIKIFIGIIIHFPFSIFHLRQHEGAINRNLTQKARARVSLVRVLWVYFAKKVLAASEYAMRALHRVSKVPVLLLP